jgi:hypothetical protein
MPGCWPDCDAIVQHITAMGAIAVVPPKRFSKRPREFDKLLYNSKIVTNAASPHSNTSAASQQGAQKYSELQSTHRSRLWVPPPSA